MTLSVCENRRLSFHTHRMYRHIHPNRIHTHSHTDTNKSADMCVISYFSQFHNEAPLAKFLVLIIIIIVHVFLAITVRTIMTFVRCFKKAERNYDFSFPFTFHFFFFCAANYFSKNFAYSSLCACSSGKLVLNLIEEYTHECSHFQLLDHCLLVLILIVATHTHTYWKKSLLFFWNFYKLKSAFFWMCSYTLHTHSMCKTC